MRLDDKSLDFSLSQKEPLNLPSSIEVPQPNIPMTLRAHKKMRLERLPLSGTTSTMMRIITGGRVTLLPEYFEQACDRRRYETAVICETSQLTYQELDQRANRLAHFLISRGIGKGESVGILLDHSLDAYISLLGILKAGAAVVPLDPLFPSASVAFVAEDAHLRGIVTTSMFRKKTSILSCPILELDQAHEILSVQLNTRPQVYVDSSSLCYIIYTFDTSNRAKGVALSHANIINFLNVVTPIFGVTRKDRVYQGISTTVDASLEETWLTWIAGATLVVNPTHSRCRGHDLTEFLIKHKITVLCCLPTLLATVEHNVPSLRTLILEGETCPAYLVNRWSHPGRRMFNTYGYTETTVKATFSELFPGRPITIGSPLPTYHVYILDHQLRQVKDGESGEIYIGGPSVAIGYFNRPELTEICFVPNPILHDRETVPRLFRTGEIGRITPAGEIERVDFSQVATVPLNVYPPVPQIASSEILKLEAETSKSRMLNLLNFKNVYSHIMTDPLYKNSLFNMASTLILGGLGFVFWILIARLYKTEYVGVATTLISILTLLSSFTILGLNSSLMRYLPKSANKNELINSSFIIVTFVALLTSIVFLLGLQIFSPQLVFLRSNTFYIISFTIFIIFCSWNTLVESTSMAFRFAGNILIKNIIISTLKLVLPFIFIAFGAYGIFASTASAVAFGVIASLIILIFKFKIKPSISLKGALIKATLVYSFANYITGFMIGMPSLILPVIILNVLSAKYAAYYYIASMIQNLLQIIPLATAQALLTEGAYNEAELKKHVKKAIVTILVILIPVTTVIVLWGNILLQFFGKSYASEAFRFLQLYSASTIFTSLILISNAVMNVKHKIKSLIISNVSGSILTLWLSYIFISDKLVGIGWGWTLGQALAALVSLFFMVRSYSGNTVHQQRLDSQ